MHTDILTPKDLFQKDVRYTIPPLTGASTVYRYPGGGRPRRAAGFPCEE